MFKKIALLLALSFSVYGKEFSEQIIHIQPVSWDELQLLQLDSLKTAKELNLSENCPTELTGFEELEPESTYFKEILWTHYFWTVFKGKSGQKCLVKHDGFDFFSKDEASSVDATKIPDYEILNTQQARVLLSASESIGFDEKGIAILRRHIGRHNGAVNAKPYKKYGGRFAMSRFMQNNKPENPHNYAENQDSYEKYKEMSYIEVFESYYSSETLKALEKRVQSNPPEDIYNDKYPFDSMESLLEAVQHDLELYKAAKKTHHKDVKASSNIYKIENSKIATVDPVIPGQRNPVYPY